MRFASLASFVKSKAIVTDFLELHDKSRVSKISSHSGASKLPLKYSAGKPRTLQGLSFGLFKKAASVPYLATKICKHTKCAAVTRRKASHRQMSGDRNSMQSKDKLKPPPKITLVKTTRAAVCVSSLFRLPPLTMPIFSATQPKENRIS